MGFEEKWKQTQGSLTRAGGVAYKHLKSHWADYILLVLIIALLGAFDSLIVKQSNHLGDLNYWVHATTRLGAYILASILGVRIGYDKYRELNQDLKDALIFNRRLIDFRGMDFGDFINEVNLETKKRAWKALINKKLAKLDKWSPRFFPFYYDSKDESGSRREDFFKPYKWKWLKNKVRKKADKYCIKRELLEGLLDDDYIKANILALNVKYPVVSKHDFDNVESRGDSDYSFYQTKAKVGPAKTKSVITGVLGSVLIVLFVGMIAFDINEALLEDQVMGLISATINGVVDIGLTLWKFLRGKYSAEKIVKQEDLRAVVDKNELLILYCVSRGIVYPKKEDVLKEAGNEKVAT